MSIDLPRITPGFAALNEMVAQRRTPPVSKGRRKDWHPSRKTRRERRHWSKNARRKSYRLATQRMKDFLLERLQEESFARRVLFPDPANCVVAPWGPNTP